ncbi:MAG: restriction endonuclease, partial [bacterium]
IAFEHFCAELLTRIGYEGLTVTKRTGDGGIDGHGDFRQGVVRIKSAFQAKRWKENAVPRDEIDKFRGAITGEYDHGVFLTTSRFSRGAQEISIKRGAITILLLDGNEIANLMIENGLGVRKQPVYIMDVDDEFFSFDEGEGPST